MIVIASPALHFTAKAIMLSPASEPSTLASPVYFDAFFAGMMQEATESLKCASATFAPAWPRRPHHQLLRCSAQALILSCLGLICRRLATLAISLATAPASRWLLLPASLTAYAYFHFSRARQRFDTGQCFRHLPPSSRPKHTSLAPPPPHKILAILRQLFPR